MDENNENKLANVNSEETSKPENIANTESTVKTENTTTESEANKTEAVKENTASTEKTETNNDSEKKQENTEKKSETASGNVFDKEEIKSETKETINQVKDTIKNVKLKEDSVATKNFVLEIFKSPFDKLKEIVEDGSGKFLKFSILILALYIIISALDEFILVSGYGSWAGTDYKIKLVIREILYPAIYVLVPTFTLLVLNKKNKKSLTTLLSTVVTAKVPVIAGCAIGIINHLNLSEISYITSPVITVCNAISYIMMYFAIKYIYKEENETEALKTFAKVWLVSTVVLSLISLVFNKIIFK